MNMYILSALILTLAYTLRANEVPKVNINVNFEYFCSDCTKYVSEQLYPTYQKLGSILDIQLNTFAFYSWTNKTNPDGTYDITIKNLTEVQGTLIQACVMEMEPIDKTLALLSCMFTSPDYQTQVNAGKQCSEKLGLNWAQINECAQGPLGRGLYIQGFERMMAVKPKITWFPWIIVNGQHTDELQDKAEHHFMKIVCDTYTGPKPDDCKNL
ncbi:unnamed protein product [Oppiella nova]|uniref:Gamma-interferon-inducible lysosomal thiol reductase n=1 Tax=Oppiella nova TaxID=334625 RepID=A0A7R9QTY9_9ACAR|nr:unnamed protein product [Oppiella nova]CAG2174299.1 unnamed protein product [Oppiella nova]